MKLVALILLISVTLACQWFSYLPAHHGTGFDIWYWAQITGTHNLIDVLKMWAFAVLCLSLPIYNLCHMSSTCSLKKQKRSTACLQDTLRKLGQSDTESQMHRQQGRIVTRLLVKPTSSYIWTKKTFVMIFYCPPKPETKTTCHSLHHFPPPMRLGGELGNKR